MTGLERTRATTQSWFSAENFDPPPTEGFLV